MFDFSDSYCLVFTNICLQVKDWLDISLSFISMSIAVIALIISIRYAKLTFRPLITVSVKSYAQGDLAIAYNLFVLNSGSIPARNIRLEADSNEINQCLGEKSDITNQEKWLACFNSDTKIDILQNGESTSCSFGTTSANNSGFWKYKSTFHITIKYEGWFGKVFHEKQKITIIDSNSFTGKFWSY